ncbi:DUF1963 domain-containing protein [Streptomyces sp. H51]|uniref:DUF1963 domain-containing protein n=1 Tax=Streptomyces sp. H51 TaxID=3111770 RepID=UPI002D78E351|nr:DUF1963 domain-containing protein [Streptomyces sp. H51]
MWNLQPSVHLSTPDLSAVGPGDHVVGHVGGLPQMPADAPWEEGTFVADLDLAAIPEQPLDLGLPREGRLLFFTSLEYQHGGQAPVLYIPPGTETAERPAPVEEVFGEMEGPEVLERRALVCRPGTAWDVLDWMWDNDNTGDPDRAAKMPDIQDVHAEERERLRPLLDAVTEYAERVGAIPFVNRSCGLRGVKLNPAYHSNYYVEDFQQKGEEAVVICRSEPDRFDDLYDKALKEGPEGAWLNLLEFGEDNLFDQGDGEVGWAIFRDDLLARRFDRVRQTYFS